MGCIYRYVNKNTEQVEYIGLVYDRPLYKRIGEHAKMEHWNSQKYRVDYITCSSRTDVEFLEAHFIAKYKTYNYYNEAKKKMGESKLLDDKEFHWIELYSCIVDGFTPKTIAREYAKMYLEKPDEKKGNLISSFDRIKDNENKKYFCEVKRYMPGYIRQILFGTSSDMIEVSIDYKYLCIGLKYIPAFTEAFYMTDSDMVYVKGINISNSFTKTKPMNKKEYLNYLNNIICSFGKLKGVFVS